MSPTDRKRYEQRLSALERKASAREVRNTVAAILTYVLSAVAFIWAANAVAVWAMGIQ
jgi:hypothetical protein